MLIKMLNGGLIDIEQDNDSYSGCPTCDYGSSYINHIKFLMVNSKLEARIDKSYDYALSDGDLLEIILPNVDLIKTMTEKEFAKWLTVEITRVARLSDREIEDSFEYWDNEDSEGGND